MVEKIKIKDKTRIKRVVFKEPELMAKDAEKIIKERYEKMKNLERDLYELRLRIIELENLCEEYKKFFRDCNLFELEFEESEKEHVVHNDTIAIRGMGNDLIGKMS